METTPARKTHIPALDGLRGLTVLIVCWYHIWQQSWLSPAFTLDLTWLGLGKKSVYLEMLPRTGYLWVDMMLLLSAFLLFLPHAKAMLWGTPVPDCKLFYRKRAARILPSYWLCAVLLFAFVAITKQYANAWAAARDFLATMSFTQTFRAETYIATKINGVMWTAAIEVAFYLIFPLLAKAFRKRPLWTYLAMTAVGLAYIKFFCIDRPDSLRINLNQLPGFFGVFANGMLAAYVYVWMDKKLSGKRPWWLTIICIGTLTAAVSLLWTYLHRAAGSTTLQLTQAQIRTPVAALFTVIVLSLSLGGKVFDAVFGNRLMRFLGTISFNLYLWHQWIAVKLKAWRIPYWDGDTLPNMAGNRTWQTGYTPLCFLVAIAVAALVTYLVEKPASDAILRARLFRKTETEDTNE